MTQAIIDMTISELSQELQARRLSAEETALAYLEQMERREPQVGAYLTVTREAALKQAKEVDQKRAKGESLPVLAGIPAGIKDNICTKGVKTTCASRMLENFLPPYDATVMERLQNQSLVMLGKLNMDEFAMGSTTENSYYQATKNPRDLTRVPGGSSGGAAACVAAQEAAYAIGSDTGGSIRQPAAFCGVVGMKPTYGAVSRYGLIAFASSLDQIGPITKNVADNALVMNALAGKDPRDATSLDHQWDDFTGEIGKEVKGMRIALPKQYFGEGISPGVKDAVLAAAKQYEALGAVVEEADLPALEYALPAYYVISSAEASSNLARFDGVKYGFRAKDYENIDELYKATRTQGFGKEVKRRIMLGSFVLSAGYYDAYYKKALQVRTLIQREFHRALQSHDLILAPVAPTTAYRLGEKTADPLQMYLGDVCTVPVNIAGIPSLSLPCGENEDGLPVGMQLIGPAYSEPMLYRAGYAFEQAKEGGLAK